MISQGFLITLFLILFVQSRVECSKTDDDHADGASIDKSFVLGMRTAKIAYHLRENLVNLVGYLMYQKKIDTDPEIFYYMREFKMGLQANLIDVFKIIPILPDLINKTLDEQMDLILRQVQIQNKVEYCHLKCVARQWFNRAVDVSLAETFAHIGYNPFLKYIVHSEEDVRDLKEVIENLQKPMLAKRTRGSKYLSAHVYKIFHEIRKKKTSLTTEVLGYLLPMYPWPLEDYDLTKAVTVMSQALIEERGFLRECGLKIKRNLATDPMQMLAKVMVDLMASKCGRMEKEAAQTILNTLRFHMPYPNYRNYLKGVYVEVNRLGEVFSIITKESYPLEIAIASERVRRYVDKIIFYVDYHKFISYKYSTKEQVLIALVTFLLQEAPYPPMKIKTSMNALKAYALFQTGPQTVSCNLLSIIVDAFLAPDLNEDITEAFLKMKLFVLDEMAAIEKTLARISTKKCSDLLTCYFQFMRVLRADAYLKKTLDDIPVPSCLVRRFLSKNENIAKFTSTATAAANLLEIIDYDLFQRDIVLAARHVREHIISTQSDMEIITKKLYCTKQETLLSYLTYLLKKSKYPASVMASMRAVAANLKYEVLTMRHVDTKVFRLIVKAWQSPFTEEQVVTEMGRIDAILLADGKYIDEQLFIMDTSICSSMLTCYNGIVEHLNEMEGKFRFKKREELSPELYVLKVGDLSLMTCELIVDIVNALQTGNEDNSELEAAKAYLEDYEDDIDLIIFDVDCVGLKVYPCFDLILDKLRFDLEDKTIKVNIIQFLLKPTTCDNRNCWWYLYEEHGCTILNPLFDYTRYLLSYYGHYEASFHIQLDVEQINDFLGFSDLEETFEKFKVNIYNNNIEKIERFLELLKEAQLLEDQVLRSANNIYLHISKNQLPDRLHYGNFIFLKMHLKELTTNTTVEVELDEILVKIVRLSDEVEEVLEHMYVDCFTLERCLETINDQVSTMAYNTPAARLISQLVKPESCMNDTDNCPWVIHSVSAQTYVQDVIVPHIINRAEDTTVDFIERIVWKVVRKLLAGNPDMITGDIKVPKGGSISDVEILADFIEQVLKMEEVDAKLKKYLTQLLQRLQNTELTVGLDMWILKEVHEAMAMAIHTERVLKAIEEIRAVLEQNEQTVDNIMVTVVVRCDNLKSCVQNIYDQLSKTTFESGIVESLLDLYISPSCPRSDCFWQVKPDKRKTALFIKKLTKHLKQIVGKTDVPFHIALNVQDALEYLLSPAVTKEAESVLESNDDNVESKFHELLFALSANRDTSNDVSTSLNNILDYEKTQQVPVYLHLTNLLSLIKHLKDMAARNTVKRILENASMFFVAHKTEAQSLLETTPVNCTTLDSCVSTLYVRIKRKNNRMAGILLSILKPSICTVELCPWIPHALEDKLERLEKALLEELKTLQHINNSLSIHVKLDMQVIKRMIRVCPECLEKIPESALNDTNNKLLVYFLKTLDDDLVAEHEIQFVKRSVEAYLASGTLPKFMDVTTLLVFAELLMRLAKSDLVKEEIAHQRVLIENSLLGVRKIMLSCPVNCVNVRTCVETLEYCLHDDSIADDYHSLLVQQVIRPKHCNRKTCTWLMSKSTKDLQRIMDEIKSELQEMITDQRVPFIMQLTLSSLRKYFEEIDKFKFYLRGISRDDPSKTSRLLHFLAGSKYGRTKAFNKLVRKALRYLKSKKVPRSLTVDDLPELIIWLIDMCTRPDIKIYMESGLNMIRKAESEITILLGICPATCVQMESCLLFLKRCIGEFDSEVAEWLIRLLFPETCTTDRCPWIGKYSIAGGIFPMSSVNNPKTIYPDEMIVFYYDKLGKLDHVTFQLSDGLVPRMLDSLKFRGETRHGRAAVVSTKGSLNKQRTLDYFHIEAFSSVGFRTEPKINFRRTDSIFVCVPFKNGHIRTLKFDLRKKGIRQALHRLSRHQVPSSWVQKPSVTLVDLDNVETNLIIDVLDKNTLRSIFVETIDEITPRGYEPVLFWPRKTTNEAWKGAVIREKSPLEVYLRNLPGKDFINEESPVIITSDGIITMDFDVHDPEIVANIEAAVGEEVCTLDIARQAKYTFYVPVLFRRNMVPISIDFEIDGTLEILEAICAKYPMDSAEPSLLIEDRDEMRTLLQFNFYSNIVQYIYHALHNQQHLTHQRTSLSYVVIPLSANETVVLDLNNAIVRDLLLTQFSDVIYRKRLIIIHILDSFGSTTPIGFDPDNAIAMSMLKSLSEKTLTPTNPIFGKTLDGRAIILVIVTDKDFKMTPIIIEDNLENKEAFERAQNIDEEALILEFSSGAVAVARSRLVEIAHTLPEVDFDGPTYIGTEEMNVEDVVLPLRYHDKLYYITITPSNSKVMDFLEHSNEANRYGPGITFTIRNEKNMLTILLPISKGNVIEKLIELATRVEIQQRPDSVMVILAPSGQNQQPAFILDLANPKVLEAVQNMGRDVNPKSNAKGLYHHVDSKGKRVPIVLDYENYDYELLSKLQQETPIELRPVHIPNTESAVPLIAFVILNEDSNQKEGIILNPSDPTVREFLLSNSDDTVPHSVKFNFRLDHGVIETAYIDKTDRQVVNEIGRLSRRTVPFKVPTKPIPFDGSWVISVNVKEEDTVDEHVINTRHEKSLSLLLDWEVHLPLAEPQMLIMTPSGKGLLVRIDTKSDHTNLQENKRFSTDDLLVINPDQSRAVVVDVSNRLVSRKLMELSENGNAAASMVVFTDYEGQVQFIRLDTGNRSVINELWQLQQRTTPSNLAPFLIVPNVGRFCWTFMVIDEYGDKSAIILDVTNLEIVTALIKMWDTSIEGIPITIEDYNGNPLTLYFDIRRHDVVQKFTVLMKKTMHFNTPLVSGRDVDKKTVLRIPYLHEDETSLINCDISDPNIVDRLLKVRGRNRKGPRGAAFMLMNRDGQLTPLYLDLSSQLVNMELKKVCAEVVTALSPTRTLVVDVKDKRGERVTNVLNVDSPFVLQELRKWHVNTERGMTARSLTDVPIFDRNGYPITLKLDTKNSDLLALLQKMTRFSLNHTNLEPFIVSEGGTHPNPMVIFGSGGPLMVDPRDERLVDSLMAFSTPYNGRSTKVTFAVKEDWTKTGFFDLDDPKLMGELRRVVDQHFEKERIFVPVTVPDKRDIVRVPCVDREGRSVLLYLDLMNNNVRKKLKELSIVSEENGQYNMKISVLKKSVKHDIYKIDTSNINACEGLRYIAFFTYYLPEESTILIMNVPNERTPIIFLDMKNVYVLAELLGLSEKTRPADATHVAIYRIGTTAKMIKLNTRDPDLVKKLIQLAKYTPAPIAPMSIENPYGRHNPYVAFTVRANDSHVKHILLNTEDPEVIRKLDGMRIPARIVKPLKITYETLSGQQKTYTVDETDDEVVRYLDDLSRASHGLMDAILNVPQKNAQLERTLLLPIGKSKGTTYSYSIAVKNVLKWRHSYRRSTSAGLIVYTDEGGGKTKGVRINAGTIFRRGAWRRSIAYVDPERVLVLTLRDVDGSPKVLILNTMSKQVMKTLMEITESTPVDKPFSTAAVRTGDEDVVTIRIDLNDVRLKEKLEPLLKITPRPMAPIAVNNPFGSKPLLVLTIVGAQNETQPILIDTNNPQAVSLLKEISEPRRSETWSVTVPGASDESIDIHVNPFKVENKKILLQISNLTQFVAAPITPRGSGILTVPVILQENMIIDVPLNTSDKYTINSLIRATKEHDEIVTKSIDGITFYLEDGHSSRILVTVDCSIPSMLEIILDVGKRTAPASSMRIRPSTGIEYLFITVMPLLDDITSATIDINNQKVMKMLEKISDTVKATKDITTVPVKLRKGSFEFNIHRNNPQTYASLSTITSMAPIQVCPFKITPPGGVNTVLSILTRIGNEVLLVPINTNEKMSLTTLRRLSQVSDVGVTNIKFVRYDGSQDRLNLNLSDYKVASSIRDIYKEESLVYYVPRRRGNPIIVIKEKRNILRIDPNVKLVFQELLELSADGLNQKDKTQLELRNKMGFSTIMYIDFNNSKVRSRLEELSHHTEILPIQMGNESPPSSFEICPILVVPPGGRYPLIMVQLRRSMAFTFDINEPSVLKQLVSLASAEVEGNKTATMEVPDNEGNSVLIRFDLSESAHNRIRNVPTHRVVSFKIEDKNLPVLVMTEQGRSIDLDIANPLVIDLLKKLSEPSQDAYKVQISLPQGKILIYLRVSRLVEMAEAFTQTTSVSSAASINTDDSPGETAGNIHATTLAPATTSLSIANPRSNNKMYWASVNLTNMVSLKTHTYIFDVSNVDVLEKLKIYSLSIATDHQAETKSLQLLEGTMVLQVNVYDEKIFEFLWELTVNSTGYPPEVAEIYRPGTWWNFTITGHYNKPIRIELDVSNADIVEKIKKLSDMFIIGRPGTIIKSNALDGKEYSLIVDLTCQNLIINLRNMEAQSKGGKPKPLKALCPYMPANGREFMKFELKLLGLSRKIIILIDINDPTVIKRLQALDNSSGASGTYYSLKIRVKKKLYRIRLNMADANTVKALIQLSKDSSGIDPLAGFGGQNIFEQIYSPNLVTIEIRDGREVIPVTLDVNDKYVVQLLDKIQTRNISEAIALEFVDYDNKNRTLFLNINSRIVINVLLSVGVPTFIPRDAVRVKLLTFIMIQVDNCYHAIALDLSDRSTVISLLVLVRMHSREFNNTVTLEVRDDCGQYVGVDVDLTHKQFLKGVMNLGHVSIEHRIQAADRPFVVLCLPSLTRGKLEVLKFKLKKSSIKYFKSLPVKRHCVTIIVTDANIRIQLDPRSKSALTALINVPGITYVQRYRPSSLVVVYVQNKREVSPMYLNLNDSETVSALTTFHNDYTMTSGKKPMAIVRCWQADGRFEYLLIQVTTQKVLSVLAKLSVHLSNHYFAKQIVEKLIKIKILTKAHTYAYVRLNVASEVVVNQLKLLSDPRATGKFVRTFNFKDAFGKTVNVTLDTGSPKVVSSLMKLANTL